MRSIRCICWVRSTCSICGLAISRRLSSSPETVQPRPRRWRIRSPLPWHTPFSGFRFTFAVSLPKRAELEAALDRGPRSQRTTTIYLGFEGKILARAILARNLWLQGHPDQAMACARQAVEEAAAADHSLTLAIALILGDIGIFMDR